MAVASVQGMQVNSAVWDSRRTAPHESKTTQVATDPWNGLAGPDEATFSAEALRGRDGEIDAVDAHVAENSSENAESGRPANGEDALTTEERQQVDKLKQRDAEVRAHEAAHMAAGGSHVRGGATYSYQQGPDGRSYAIGGEVGIDVSPVSGNPQATIQKMQQVRAAALSPAEPSGADRAVAARAAQHEATAREQMASQKVGYAAAPEVAGAGGEATLASRALEAFA